MSKKRLSLGFNDIKGENMITRDNLMDVIGMLTLADIKKADEERTEFVKLTLHVFNVGSWVKMECTDDYEYEEGEALLGIDEFFELFHKYIEFLGR